MKKLLLLVFVLLSSIGTIMAQRSISGTVSDEEGAPLIGATILVQGTSTGAVTDIDGRYTVSLPDGSTVLSFSYTGYESQQITVGASNILDVTMAQDAAVLNEVIVTGYSQVEAKKLISSVAVVGDKAITNVPMPDINQIIQGRAAGVMTTSPSGQPGAQQDIRIRGTGSITAGRGPLYVIDGIIVEQGDFTSQATSSDALANINPNDIENITVLKDASATALYGSRGSNGVVLVTTKRGKAGQSTVTAKVQQGYTDSYTGNFRIMNAQEAWDYERIVLENSGFAPDDFRPASRLDQTTDWVDESFRTGKTSNVELQAQGGNEKTRFFLSGGLFNQEGILIESDFSRLSLRSNIDHKASDKLDFALNFNGSYTDNLNATAGNRFASPLLGAFSNSPLARARRDDGSLFTGQESDWEGTFPDNYVYSMPLNPVNNRSFRLLTKATVNYNILENLRFTQTANIDFLSITENVFQDPTTNDGADTNGQINEAYNENRTLTTQSLLKYFASIGQDHNFDFLAGFEFQDTDRRNFQAQGIGLASGQLKTLNSAAEPSSVSGFNSEYTFASWLGQVNYNFKEKYYFTASGRRDGSSRFSADNRYATFWSVGASWILTEENFLNNVSFLNNLRLRASYGITGNASIGNFPALELYSFGAAYGGQPGSTPSQIANPDLTWETGDNVNIGLDFGVFNNRVSGTVEYYRRVGSDLLLNVPVSSTSGFTTATQNIGEIENSGIEVVLSFSPVVAKSNGGFSWDVDMNVSANRNEIISLPDNEDITNGNQIYSVGLPIRTFNLRQWAGVNPDDGTPLWFTDEDGSGTTGVSAQAPRVKGGNAEPQWIGGLNNTFSWKGISLSAFFYTMQGHDVLNSTRRFIESDGQRYGWNHISTASEGIWTQAGDQAERPQPRIGGNNNANTTSTRYLEDGSFIRLRNVTLGYSLPKSLTDRMKLRNVSLYVQGQNLWTITDYQGFDPEMDESGTEFFRYPVGGSVTFGLDVTF